MHLPSASASFGPEPRQLRQLRDFLFCPLKRARSCFGYKDLLGEVGKRVILHLGCSSCVAARVRPDRKMEEGEADTEIVYCLNFFA